MIALFLADGGGTTPTDYAFFVGCVAVATLCTILVLRFEMIRQFDELKAAQAAASSAPSR